LDVRHHSRYLLRVQHPDFPTVPPAQRTQGALFMRFEDVAQDGALKVTAMPAAIGLVCMGKLWFKTPASSQLRAQGVVPILTRISMVTTGGPLSVRNKVEVDGAYELGHACDDSGAVSRILINGHAELYAPAARTHPPQPSNAGERVHVGRVFAEHVFTRPFGPAHQRKVLALPTAEGPLVPALALPFRSPLATLSIPGSGRQEPGAATEPAQWLEPALMLDPMPVTFGITHTDSNQHVNSLVYPQLFEDAALRRLFDLGHATSTLLVDQLDVAFRKPCFAGERMYVWLRAFQQTGKLGLVAYLGPRDCPPDKAHCTAAMTFRDGVLG
jgi:hypothetical protein